MVSKYDKDYGGSVTLIGGGLNQTFIELMFISEVSKGMDFKYEAFVDV